MIRLLTLAVCATAAVALSTSARAQDPLTQLYGMGVHAYHSHDLAKAQELLTQAIGAGSQDPRVYFFRGLVQSRMGGEGAGMADYEQGARLEAEGRVASNVNRALTRIQGPERLIIEKVRLDARIEAQAQALLMRRAEPITPIPGGVAPGMNPNAVDPAPVPEATDPFLDDPTGLDGAAEDMPAVVTPESTDDTDSLFGGDSDDGSAMEPATESDADDGGLFGSGDSSDTPPADDDLDDDIFGGF